MSQEIENQLNKIPVIKWVVRFLKSIQLPGLEGLSLYELSEMYVLGIINGALSIRASAVAFSFFMAIFPFLLFIIILMPYIPIESFQSDFLSLLEASLPPNTSDFFNQNIFENINAARHQLERYAINRTPGKTNESTQGLKSHLPTTSYIPSCTQFVKIN